MEEKKYLNEEDYQKNAKKLKKIGKIVLIVGLCMLALGVISIIAGVIGIGSTGVNVVSSSSVEPASATKGILGFGLFALGGFLDTTGLFVTAIGGMILLIAHRREITAFSVQQTMPVAKEGIDEMAPTIGNAAGEIAKGIKKGLNEED